MTPLEALALKKKQAAVAALQSAAQSQSGEPDPNKTKIVKNLNRQIAVTGKNTPGKALKAIEDEEEGDEANEEGLNKNMNKKNKKANLSHESTNIANFLKAISQKNYAQADKYLQGTVEGKLKAAINKAVQNSK